MLVATCQTDSHPPHCQIPLLFLYSGSQSNLLVDLGELTRLKSETLAHPDHIAQLPCILSTQPIVHRIGSFKTFPSEIRNFGKQYRAFRGAVRPGKARLQRGISGPARVRASAPEELIWGPPPSQLVVGWFAKVATNKAVGCS